MTAHRFGDLIPRARRRPSGHRLVLTVARNVRDPPAGGAVTSRGTFLEALHHDPVELAAELPFQQVRRRLSLRGDRRNRLKLRGQPTARPWRLDFTDDTLHFAVCLRAQLL